MQEQKIGVVMNKKVRKYVKEKRDSLLTIREEELLEHLKRIGQLKDAAEEMRISYRRAEYLIANIRRKWELAVNTHNRLVALCKRDSALRKLLSKPAPRRKLKG